MREIEPHDVHRVALDGDGRRWKVLYVKAGAVCAYCESINAMRLFGANGICRTNHSNLMCWDLDTIPGEKRWWLVARNVTLETIIDIDFGQNYDRAKYMEQSSRETQNVQVLGLIYDVHYAGYPVGTIHTEVEMEKYNVRTKSAQISAQDPAGRFIDNGRADRKYFRVTKSGL